LFYLQFPKEALASINMTFSLVVLLLVYILFIGGVIALFHQIVFKNFKLKINFSTFKLLKINILNILFFAAIVAVGARGGTNLAPFNASYVYFSNRPILNHTALNASWSLVFSSILSEKEEEYNYLSEKELSEHLNTLKQETKCDSTISILTTKRPNIILVILEGWTSDIVKSLGGIEGVSPNFENLIDEGLLFNNFYASGDRTYKGVPAILSGFPALPNGSVIKYTSKMENLNSISNSLKQKNYATSFLYGGELSFANIRAYIQHCNYESVIDKFDFLPAAYKNSKWGIHDHVLFERAIRELKNETKPFFTTILTQSSHEPYDVPMETRFSGNSNNELFKNSVFYTDKSLGAFMDQAKEQEWYDSTLFIFLADHGKNLPLNRANWSPEMFKIPLLFYGEVLKKRYHGNEIEKYGSQTDLAKTLLHQMSFNKTDFYFSRNLLDCSKDFAFYTFNGGFGWVTPNEELVFDIKSEKLFYENYKTKDKNFHNELLNAKAYLQKLGITFNEM
jgi:phosphoglycerol transferase MdoB-like AlkP superfamily enzyme